MRGLARRSLAAVLVSTIAVAVGSCSGGEACACTYPADDPSAVVDDGPVIATDPRARGDERFDPAGSITGVLSLDRGCLVIDDAVLLWPDDTTWDNATSSVHVPKWSASVPTGRRVRLGGGFLGRLRERPEWLPVAAFRDAKACVDRGSDRRQLFLVARDEPRGH